MPYSLHSKSFILWFLKPRPMKILFLAILFILIAIFPLTVARYSPHCAPMTCPRQTLFYSLYDFKSWFGLSEEKGWGYVSILAQLLISYLVSCLIVYLENPRAIKTIKAPTQKKPE